MITISEKDQLIQTTRFRRYQNEYAGLIVDVDILSIAYELEQLTGKSFTIKSIMSKKVDWNQSEDEKSIIRDNEIKTINNKIIRLTAKRDTSEDENKPEVQKDIDELTNSIPTKYIKKIKPSWIS